MDKRKLYRTCEIDNNSKHIDFNIKEAMRTVKDSIWFDFALLGISYAIPYATGPMMAASGRILPKAGQVLAHAPKIINAYVVSRRDK